MTQRTVGEKMIGVVGFQLPTAVLVLAASGVLACGGARPAPATEAKGSGSDPAVTAPEGTASSNPTQLSIPSPTFSNDKLGYSWTLSDGWESVPPESLWSSGASVGQELHAARKKGQQRPAIWVWVTDLVQIVPGPRDQQRDLKHATTYAELMLKSVNGHVASSRGVQMLGHDASEVNGTIGETAVSIRTIYTANRKLEFRCLGPAAGPAWPCAEALQKFQIKEVATPLMEQETPVVLHLRAPELGFGFDAPDDSWLGRGPRKGGNGGQSVWFWNRPGPQVQQIDVGVTRMSGALSKASADSYAAQLADATRRGGSQVTDATSTLAGMPCHHLVINEAGGKSRDAFILARGSSMYMVLVSQDKRDPAIVEAARKGFRLISE